MREKFLAQSIYSGKYIEMQNNTMQDTIKSELKWQGRLWLEGNEGTFLGYGRVVLLERIRQYSSLAQAARSMEMSYKHAWDLLASMNRQAGCKLVETSRGGKSGGGARLTVTGERAIAVFWQYHAQFQDVLRDMTVHLGEVLSDAEKTGGCQGGP